MPNLFLASLDCFAGSRPSISIAAAGRLEQRRQHFDRGRFARTIWPEKRKDLTRLNIKRNVVNGRKIAECFCKVFDFDHKDTY